MGSYVNIGCFAYLRLTPRVTGESLLITDPQRRVIREIDRVDSVVPEARQRRWELGVGAVGRAARGVPEARPKRRWLRFLHFPRWTLSALNDQGGAPWERLRLTRGGRVPVILIANPMVRPPSGAADR